MKKLLIIISLLTFILIPTNTYAESKVNIYFFRGYNCNHCEEALEYINNNKDQIPNNINIITYEVWKNKDNAKLYNALSEKLNVPETKQGSVPFIVIGNEYIIGMLPSPTDFSEILDKASSYATKEDYEDLVSNTINELKKEDKSLNFSAKTIDDLFKDNKVVSIIVFSIFGIVLVGFIAMILFSRKKN